MNFNRVKTSDSTKDKNFTRIIYDLPLSPQSSVVYLRGSLFTGKNGKKHTDCNLLGILEKGLLRGSFRMAAAGENKIAKIIFIGFLIRGRVMPIVMGGNGFKLLLPALMKHFSSYLHKGI